LLGDFFPVLSAFYLLLHLDEPHVQVRVEVGADAAESSPALSGGEGNSLDVRVEEAEVGGGVAETPHRRQLGAHLALIAARVLVKEEAPRARRPSQQLRRQHALVRHWALVPNRRGGPCGASRRQYQALLIRMSLWTSAAFRTVLLVFVK
jgi:hypothetical protein